MRRARIRQLGRLSVALSTIALVLWAGGASAELKQLSGIKVVPSGNSTPAGPTLKGSKQSVSLGDDSGKKLPGTGLVPQTHTVKKGDTLWDICDAYFANPWQWPRVWSYNPDILNPHWIYPGEIVRLKKDAPSGSIAPAAGSGGAGKSPKPAAKPLPGTVFLRNIGFVYDKDVQQNGEITGSPEDKMLLAASDRVYIRLGTNQAKDAQPGDEMTLYQTTRAIKSKSGSTVGDVVEILGTVKLTRVDNDKHVAEGTITESLDVIERGARVGPVDRKLDVVAATTNQVDVQGELLESVHPNVMFGQNQIVLIDKGETAGLRVGNRLFVLTKGDPWQQGLSSAGALAAGKVTLGTDSVEFKAGTASSNSDAAKDYPEEVIAEIRVLRVRKDTATCIVTHSQKELAPGDRWLAKKGY